FPGPVVFRDIVCAMPRAVAVLGAAVLAVLVGGSAQGQAPNPPSGPTPLPITSLVDQAVGMFPQLAGDVVEAQGRTVTISIGRKAGAQVGLALEVFREGREIRHPKTGAVLGRAEEPQGRAVVTQAFDGYSIATVETDAIKAGDRVRTTVTR